MTRLESPRSARSWMLALLALLIVAGTGACAPQESVPGSTSELPTDPPAETVVLFDDFLYSEFEEMTGNGWRARTEPGIPGVVGASFGPEGVSFIEDPDNPGNRLLRLTSETAGTAETTHQVQICHERKYLEGTYAARVRFDDGPDSGPDGDQIVETFYTISHMDEPAYSEADFEYLPNGGWVARSPPSGSPPGHPGIASAPSPRTPSTPTTTPAASRKGALPAGTCW